MFLEKQVATFPVIYCQWYLTIDQNLGHENETQSIENTLDGCSPWSRWLEIWFTWFKSSLI